MSQTVNHNFRQLRIWTDAMRLVGLVYRMTEAFPQKEQYRLTDQMTRAAVSIPSNIAEGSAKSTNKHFASYLGTSLGSAFEIETQTLIAIDLGYLRMEECEQFIADLQKLQNMIYRFQQSLTSSHKS